MENQDSDAAGPSSSRRGAGPAPPSRSSPALPLETPIRPPATTSVSATAGHNGQRHSSLAGEGEHNADSSKGTEDESEQRSRQQQQQPAEPGSYLLTWTDEEMKRTRISSASQLQSLILSEGTSTSHLFIIHGLPTDFLPVLRESVGVSTPFLEAHVGRRVNRKARFAKKQAAKGGNDYSHFDYPELVRRSDSVPIVVVEGEGRGDDLVGDPPIHWTSEPGGGGAAEAVMLCRASAWFSASARILFLDRPSWSSPSSGLSRGRYKSNAAQWIPDADGIATVTMSFDADGNPVKVGDEIPSLETLLYENLRDEWYDCGDLGDFIEDMMIHQWAIFFDAFEEGGGTSALYWQAQNCLERDLDVARLRDKTKSMRRNMNMSTGGHAVSKMASATVSEWEALVERMGRRVQLLRLLTPLVVAGDTVRIGAQQQQQQEQGQYDANAILIPPPRKPTGGSGDENDRNTNFYNNNAGSRSSTDEHQRSLDRVTYLGGVALPFTVVSGILSMSEPFNAGGAMFYVFWIVAIPIALFAVVVIYADRLRKAQVWIEAASEGVADGSSADGFPISDDDDDDDEGEKPGRPGNENGIRPGGATPQRLEEGITYSYSEPITYSGTETPVPMTRIAHAASMPVQGEEPEIVGDDSNNNNNNNEPDTFVEKRWRGGAAARRYNNNNNNNNNASSGTTGPNQKMHARKWQKEELGWMGACATLFNVYKLKKGVPPGWSGPPNKRQSPGGVGGGRGGPGRRAGTPGPGWPPGMGEGGGGGGLTRRRTQTG